MAVNKVIYDGETLMDVTDSTVSEENLLSGAVAYNSAGERIVGAVVTVPVDSVPTSGSSNAVSSGGVFDALQNVGGGSATVYTITIPASGWAASGSYMVQTVSVTGLKADYSEHPKLDCAVTNTDAESDAAMLAAFSLITGAETTANSITFYAAGNTAPDVNLQVYLEVLE